MYERLLAGLNCYSNTKRVFLKKIKLLDGVFVLAVGML